MAVRPVRGSDQGSAGLLARPHPAARHRGRAADRARRAVGAVPPAAVDVARGHVLPAVPCRPGGRADPHLPARPARGPGRPGRAPARPRVRAHRLRRGGRHPRPGALRPAATGRRRGAVRGRPPPAAGGRADRGRRATGGRRAVGERGQLNRSRRGVQHAHPHALVPRAAAGGRVGAAPVGRSGRAVPGAVPGDGRGPRADLRERVPVPARTGPGRAGVVPAAPRSHVPGGRRPGPARHRRRTGQPDGDPRVRPGAAEPVAGGRPRHQPDRRSGRRPVGSGVGPGAVSGGGARGRRPRRPVPRGVPARPAGGRRGPGGARPAGVPAVARAAQPEGHPAAASGAGPARLPDRRPRRGHRVPAAGERARRRARDRRRTAVPRLHPRPPLPAPGGAGRRTARARTGGRADRAARPVRDRRGRTARRRTVAEALPGHRVHRQREDDDAPQPAPPVVGRPRRPGAGDRGGEAGVPRAAAGARVRRPGHRAAGVHAGRRDVPRRSG